MLFVVFFNKFKKIAKNLLTNEVKSGRILKLSRDRISQRPRQAASKDLEKIQKTFEKPLDKVEKMWYNIEVAAKNGNDPVQGFEKRS